MRREFTVNGYPVREITPYTAKTGYRKYGEHAFLYETPDGVLTIDYELQPTGYGQKPLLICPKCGSRRSKLYHAGDYVFCRGCMKMIHPLMTPYTTIQNSTKWGSDYIAYLEERLAKKNGIEHFTIADFLGDNWIITDHRPRYMRKATFADVIGRLRLLDELRARCIFSRYTGGKSTVDKWTLDKVCKAPPRELLGVYLYDDTIALAEEVYRLPIKDRLLQNKRDSGS